MMTTHTERVLVTGAGGFIASAVVRALAADGCEVVGIERDASSPRQRANLDALRRDVVGFELVHADMLDVDLCDVLRRVDAVVHLAGSPGVESSWSSGFAHHLDNNVLATQRLLEAALDAPVRRIVVASSSSVYGTVPAGRAQELRTPMRPLSPYGASKAAMEMLIGAYIARGISVAPLRYFTVFGPQQRPDMAMYRIIDAACTGRPFSLRGDGHQERSFTYVDDVARATVASIGVSSTEPINVGGAVPTSLTAVISMVEDIMGVPVPIAAGPDLPGDPLRTSADTTRARSLLGWQPEVDLRAGLERQIAWQLATVPAAAAR